ncbi:aconitate hydratase [Desulfomonile tiedjei]|uniref:Aconitase n=1 Tax=Desulfomonile tiedjei (strain ATCC 49306 / DSM 6799 / DCB-1) TaxID=706587 RepID=I4C4I6_DESTA|nr:aconitate hydratase [Desulfomonile tiedjei]AFM24477.1 aconitase [Desulfomonile tiedjei DSM 6799]
MGKTVAEKIIEAHLVEGDLKPGSEIAIKIDHTLTQDATGTMVFLEFMAMGIPRVKTEVSVSYVDHNLLQTDFKNADDHRFLRSVAAKFGVIYSRPGNGISHQVHLERFSVPGKTLLGSDSHTPTNAGSSMLAIGAGGLDVAMAMAGQPFYFIMPRIVGVKLTGALQPWVSGKDVILEMLRRLTVKGGVGKIFEYFGPGVETLSATDRATIGNMGAELGATSSMFPSDRRTREFLESQGRGHVWSEIIADPDAEYSEVIEIDLNTLEPLIACPSSPDNIKKVSEVEGIQVGQVIVGSSVNSSFRDLMITAKSLEERHCHPDVSLEINPGSSQVLLNVSKAGGVSNLILAGARIHQSGCLGCIGMGQAPGTGTVSLRTFPRNFPGRSGTFPDQVYLCSPETAVAAAIFGSITDPRKLGEYPVVKDPEQYAVNDDNFIFPPEDSSEVEVLMGPNIKQFPIFGPLDDTLEGPVILKVPDNITTDAIMPAGSKVLPFRSNIPAISAFVFEIIDPGFHVRAASVPAGLIVAGENYGQGSSREHAAIAPRYLNIRAKLAKSFARIHKANLINFGILPLVFANPEDYDALQQGETIRLENVRAAIQAGSETIIAKIKETGREVRLKLNVTDRERKILLAGGLINFASTS